MKVRRERNKIIIFLLLNEEQEEEEKKESQAYHFYKVNTSRRLFHILVVVVRRETQWKATLLMFFGVGEQFFFSFLVAKDEEKNGEVWVESENVENIYSSGQMDRNLRKHVTTLCTYIFMINVFSFSSLLSLSPLCSAVSCSSLSFHSRIECVVHVHLREVSTFLHSSLHMLFTI